MGAEAIQTMETVLMFLVGLAFFLYGMNAMSSGLEKLAGGKMEKTLKKMTSNPLKAMGLGMGITAVIQSSSAMTVMLVGLVNSGIMALSQSIGVIMGSNIGTTVTAWILTLTGIESDPSNPMNFWITLCKPTTFSPILAIIGIFMIMVSKKPKKRDIGGIMVAFAVLMYGMDFMGDAVKEVQKANPDIFTSMFAMLSNPILGVLVGAIVTAIIQSSSASVGILQTVAATGGMTYAMAIPIIFGQNIGTCVTSLISSIGANKNAKRVVVVHFAFNLIGTTIFMVLYFLLYGLLNDVLFAHPIDQIGIATVHTVFNVCTTALLLPMSGLLEKLATAIVREGSKERPAGYLDERLLQTPSVAIVESKRQIVKMAELARDTLIDAIGLLDEYNEKKAEEIIAGEDTIDIYEDTIGSYLVKLSAAQLSEHDAAEISKLLLSIGDFERLGDHAVNILHAAREMKEKELTFSDEAKRELQSITAAMNEIFRITVDSFDRSDLKLAAKVEPLEQVIDGLIATMNARHIERLKAGKCTIELGFILADVLNNCQRASDHCSNIAVCLIQTKRDAFETHSYLNKVKTSGQRAFVETFNHYATTYVLPEE